MMDNIISFTKVKGEYGWLGNFAPYPIEFNNKVWKTSEHLFQALRLMDHTEPYVNIYRESNPFKAKLIAKKFIKENDLKNITLTNTDLNLMRTVVGLKFKQHPELREKLIQTKDKTIIEDVTKRIGDCNSSSLFWGAALIQGKHWVGLNWLGKILEEIRDIYLED